MLNSLDRFRARARANWRPSLRMWFWGQVILIWVLAQTLPVDVLDRLPVLRALCAPIVAAVAYIPGYIGRSAFPQVTELVVCLGWLIAPLNVLFGVLFPEHFFTTKPKVVFGYMKDLKAAETGITAFFLAGIFMLILVPMLFKMFVTVPMFDPRFKYGITDDLFYSHSVRATLGIAAQVMSNGLGWLAAYWIVLAGHFIGSLVSMFRKSTK
jgi:hypothetical protein